MKRHLMKWACCASVGAVSMALAAPSFAQGATAEADPNDPIVVTGSLIRGTPEDGILPVDVFSAEDLQQTGSPNPLDFIKSLPAIGQVLGDSNQFSTSAQGFVGVGSVNLRGLGAPRTLVLLNGRRTIVTPGDGFTDTNLVPMFAIGRVEILKDGAAATYGSDAIAGVVNFITKDRFEGVEMAADYRFISGSRGDYSANIFGGHVGEGWRISGGAAYQHRSELDTTDRDWASQPYTVNPSAYSLLGSPGSFWRASRTPNALNPTANPFVVAPQPTYTFLAAAPVRDANCANLGGIVDTTGGRQICQFSYVPYDNIVEEENRIQVFAEASVDLSDDVTFHIEGLWAHTDVPRIAFSPSYPPTQGPRGPGSSNAFYIPGTNPGYATFLAQTGQTVPANFTVNSGVLAFLWRPFGNGANPATGSQGQIGSRETEGWRISGGFKGDITAKLGFDVSATYSNSERHSVTTDIVGVRLQAALLGLGGAGCNQATGTPGVGECHYLNPFSNGIAGNPSVGLTNPGYVPALVNDPATVGWLFEKTGANEVEKTLIVDALINGETGIMLPGGEVGFALGFQYRQIDYTNVNNSLLEDPNLNPCPIPGDLTCAQRVGPFIFLGNTPNSVYEQDVKAVFAEVNLPLLDTLSVSGALRYEDYGGQVGSTLNPKASIRWQPTEWLALRGSAGTTFRGPLASQVSNGAITTLSGLAAVGNAFKSVRLTGNPALSPETAFTYNLGAVITSGGFTASADYWSFNFKDRISQTPAAAIANSVLNGPGTGAQLVNCAAPLRDLIIFANNNVCTQGTTVANDATVVLTQWVNGPRIKTSGIDLSAEYSRDLGDITATIGANAAYILNFDVADFTQAGVLFQSGYSADGLANYNRDPGTISKWRGNAFLNINGQGLNWRYSVRYVQGVDDNRCITGSPCATTNFGTTDFGRHVASFYQHDLHMTYDLPITEARIQLQLSIENIFNSDPSLARLEYSYDPFIGNPLGSTVRFGIRSAF